MASNDNQKQRSYLFDLGWVRQKSEWLNELRKFAGMEGRWIDLSKMDAAIRAQVASGTAYVDEFNHKVEEKHALFIRLDTGIIVPKDKTGDADRYLIVKFHRNTYGMWAGLDFEYGDEAEFDPEETSDSKKKDPLYEDIFWRQGWQDELRQLAVDEPWENEYGPCGRLLPYLKYTYLRLKLEDKEGKGGNIAKSDDGKWMAFNTGLASRDNLYPIVALCKKNAKAHPEWEFDRFIVWPTEKEERKQLALKDTLAMGRFSSSPPSKANWFGNLKTTILTPSEIKEDWTEIEEIFQRPYYPPTLLLALSEAFENEGAQQKALALIRMEEANLPSEKKMRDATAGEILKSLGDPDDVRRQALVIVQGSFKQALRRLEWEMGTAVPMWEPSSNDLDKYSFMLPLSFKSDPLRADIALRLVSTDGQSVIRYRPFSFLSLRAAYSDARLLRRPEALWLRDYIEGRFRS